MLFQSVESTLVHASYGAMPLLLVGPALAPAKGRKRTSEPDGQKPI